MNYENDEKLIEDINKRNKDILNFKKDSFEDFQEYKKNESLLSELRVKRDLEKKIVVDKVEKKNNSHAVYWILSFSIIFIFSIIIGFLVYSQDKREEEVLSQAKDFDFKKAQEKEFRKFEQERRKKEEEEQKLQFQEELRKKELILLKEKEEKESAKLIKSVEKIIMVSTETRGDSLGYFYAYENNKLVKTGRISAGKKHYETPVGKFKVLEKQRYHTSKTYPSSDGTNNMDYMIRLTWGGIALHMGNPNQISHGCVHIDPKDAEWLFNWTDLKTTVYLTTKKISKKKKLSGNLNEINEWNGDVKKVREQEREEIEYWPNGNFKKIDRYKGDYLHGIQSVYWENGYIKEEKVYKTGRWSGKSMTYWDNGRRHKEFIWKNDELKSGKSWDREGNQLSDFVVEDE